MSDHDIPDDEEWGDRVACPDCDGTGVDDEDGSDCRACSGAGSVETTATGASQHE